MLKELLEGLSRENYREFKDETFELTVYKTKGNDCPGLKFKGSQHGLLAAYLKLIEIIIEQDAIPAKILHDALMLTAEKYDKVDGIDESK